MLTQRIVVASLIGVLVSAGALLVLPDMAAADGPCPPGYTWTGRGCTPDDPPDPPDDDPGTGCNQADPAVINAPCEYAGYTFSSEHDSYLKILEPQPPTGDPLREGHPLGDGAVYESRKLSGIPTPGNPDVWASYDYIWLAGPPGPPPVDPEDLAEQILLDMDLRPVAIGIAPRPGVGSAGLVGLPNWTWAEDPSSSTWGPLVVSQSAGANTVTVTAEVDHVTWDMGDGSSHVCTTPGTPFKESYGIQHSPDCGGQHAYASVGDYTVTAISTWSVAWEASNGASGDLDVDPVSSNVDIAIRELQVIGQQR